VVAASAFAGVSSYTFMTFLTATAVEEMGATAAGAGALLWAMGGVGVVASVLLGRVGDQGSPTLAVTWMFLVCGLGLAVVSLFWGYPALVVAALGVAVLNYPVWGVVAAIATNRFEPPSALRAVSLGLVGAATLSALANVIAGQWIDQVGSMRLPVVVLSFLTLAMAAWLGKNYRAHVLD
jgi:predicted MFS family arabinose efflux permease